MPFDGDATTIEALDRLRYGRAQIAAGKWCRNMYSDNRGRRCAVGWIDMEPVVTELQFKQALALQALYAALPPSAKHYSIWPVRCITHYNDRYTRRDVLALYDRAIAALDVVW